MLKYIKNLEQKISQMEKERLTQVIPHYLLSTMNTNVGVTYKLSQGVGNDSIILQLNVIPYFLYFC